MLWVMTGPMIFVKQVSDTLKKLQEYGHQQQLDMCRSSVIVTVSGFPSPFNYSNSGFLFLGLSCLFIFLAVNALYMITCSSFTVDFFIAICHQLQQHRRDPPPDYHRFLSSLGRPLLLFPASMSHLARGVQCPAHCYGWLGLAWLCFGLRLVRPGEPLSHL